MPWKECSVMDERLRFVARLLNGEAMSEVCRAFGISRKTGYKIFERICAGVPSNGHPLYVAA
jgi:transposase-like protein